MAELKTRETKKSVEKFLKGITDEKRRKDCVTVAKLMQEVTRAEPKMWGPSIVGFGDYRCRYASGREIDWFLTGFSPRKQALTLYLMSGFTPHEDLMAKLGKHATGKGCLYIKDLDGIHLPTLKTLIRKSVGSMKKREGKAWTAPD